MRTPSRRSIAVVFLVSALALSSACGTTGSHSTAGFVESMLAEVPDTTSSRVEVQMSDLAAARQLTGIQQPAHDASRADLSRYAPLFTGSSTSQPKAIALTTQLFARGSRLADFRRELGFSLVDVDQALQAGVPPDPLEVFRGDHIVADEVDEAVHADLAWKDVLTVRSHGGERYYRWLDDRAIQLRRVSATRPIGEARRLAVDGHEVRWARSDDVVEASIDAGRNKTTSLADDDTFRSVARALDSHRAYNATLLADSDAWAARAGKTPASATGTGGTPLRPWSVLGVGDAVERGSPVGIVVIAGKDEATARTNVDRFRRRIAEGTSPVTRTPYAQTFSIRSIKADGSLVIAVLKMRRPAQLSRLIVARDPLFAYA